jgi:hypothetical protein
MKRWLLDGRLFQCWIGFPRTYDSNAPERKDWTSVIDKDFFYYCIQCLPFTPQDCPVEFHLLLTELQSSKCLIASHVPCFNLGTSSGVKAYYLQSGLPKHGTLGWDYVSSKPVGKKGMEEGAPTSSGVNPYP